MSDDPKVKALDLYNHGVKLLNQEPKTPDNQQLAYRFFASAIDCDSTLPEPWFGLGNINSEIELWDAAVTCWKKGAALAPTESRFYTNIGHRLYHLGRLGEARKATENAISISPEDGRPWANLSLIESVSGNHKKAISAARRGYDLSPDPMTQLSLSFALMFSGEYKEGLFHFEARFPYKLTQYLSFPYPQWWGEDISDKTLFLMSEQGLGDTLSFMRFVPAIAERAGKVKFKVQRELYRVAVAAFAHLLNVEVAPLPAPFDEADVWVSLTSAPVALGLTTQEIIAAPNPYIPEFPAPMHWKKDGAKLHVGVAWQGAKCNDVDRWRSFPVDLLFPLALIPGVQLYSIQTGEPAMDMHNRGGAGFIVDLSPYLQDVATTLSIMRELDVVVTCESAVRHMAGIIGKPCLVPYSYNGGDWRCGRGQKHPLWDKGTMLFRQGPDASWGGPFMSIGLQLEAMAKGKR